MIRSVTADLSTDRSASILLGRLERLPVIPTHYVWGLILAANLMLEYYDNAIFAYSMPTIQRYTSLSLEQIGVVSSAFFVGMMIGAVIGGRLSDRFGRRPVLVWMTVLYALGALATAFSSNFEAMFVARIVTGIGVQAATSVLLVYVAEMFPSAARGRFVSVVSLGFVISAPVAAGLALFVLPHGGPNAWRHLFIAGSVGLLVAPLVRFCLPESVRWCVSRGETEKAARIVEKLENDARRRGPLEPPRALPTKAQEASLRELFMNRRVLRTLAVVSIGYFGTTLGYYLFGNWALYALVKGLGYPEEQAYTIAFIWNLVYCLTPFLCFLFIDKFERKTLTLAMSVISAVPLVLLGISTDSVIVTVAGGVAAITTGLVVNVYYTYIPETIPTKLRALGSGIVIAIGRSGGAVAGVLGAVLFSSGGMAAVMIAAALSYVLFSVVILLFGPRTTNRSLENVEDSELGSANGGELDAAGRHGN